MCKKSQPTAVDSWIEIISVNQWTELKKKYNLAIDMPSWLIITKSGKIEYIP